MDDREEKPLSPDIHSQTLNGDLHENTIMLIKSQHHWFFGRFSHTFPLIIAKKNRQLSCENLFI